MNDPFDPSSHGRLHDVASAINVGSKNFFWIWGPQTIVSGHMKNVTHACHRTVDRSTVAHIAFEKFDVQASEGGVRISLTDERADRISGLDEFVRDSRADEPGCSSDQNFFVSAHPSRISPCGAFAPRRPSSESASTP